MFINLFITSLFNIKNTKKTKNNFSNFNKIIGKKTIKQIERKKEFEEELKENETKIDENCPQFIYFHQSQSLGSRIFVWGGFSSSSPSSLSFTSPHFIFVFDTGENLIFFFSKFN